MLAKSHEPKCKRPSAGEYRAGLGPYLGSPGDPRKKEEREEREKRRERKERKEGGA